LNPSFCKEQDLRVVRHDYFTNNLSGLATRTLHQAVGAC
jgi:hypothetical protein